MMEVGHKPNYWFNDERSRYGKNNRPENMPFPVLPPVRRKPPGECFDRSVKKMDFRFDRMFFASR